ncbi:hypothetical protein V3C99_018132 [Haemonchus contortus]|uniref:RNA-directed DNA polymerase from transposon BS n=1 Tax=Haemonchus contortus TaxID=6289 RepID=A0A7I4Z5N9_HAECO
MRGEPLVEADTIRDLGFIIDRNLSFKEHCHCIVNNAEVRLFHLFKSFCSIDPFPLIEAYKLYVRPMLEYGTCVFSPCSKSLVNRLERVQHSFTRKVFIRSLGFTYSSIPRGAIRNKILKLESLNVRRRRNDLHMVYKILHGLVDLELRDFFRLNPSSTRGQSLKIVLQQPKSVLRRNFFTFRAGYEYTKLGKKLQIPCCFSGFKRIVNNYIT